MKAVISNKTLTEIMLFLVDHGETATINHYGFALDTLNRYRRQYKFDRRMIPKVLLLDIETAPMKVLSWSLFRPYLSHENIIEKGFILSWSAKWLFSSEIMGDVITPKEVKTGNDKRISQSIWELLNDADVIIGHNVRKFDIKWLNTEFIINGLKPPMPYQTIDTLIEARKYFKFPSNRLDYLGKIMARKGKMETAYKLWKECLNGNKESLDYMLKYNKEDVLLLEDVYIELRPWIKSHPNMGLYIDAEDNVCGNCGSENLLWEDKYYVTMASKFAAYRCKDCGAISRCKTTALSKEQRKNLLVSVAR